ncbi:MAG: hypothetical protein ACLS7Z_06860 [Christensenellales bacterium]
MCSRGWSIIWRKTRSDGVYIRTKDVLTADNVSRNLLGRVGFEPDGESDSFNMEKYEYVAVLDSKDLMTLEETGTWRTFASPSACRCCARTN